MANYGITSSSQLIDVVRINEGIQIINAAAEKFEKCAQLVLSASQICNEDALAVDKTTMESQLQYDATEIQKIKTYIENYTLELNNVAVQVLSAQQNELDDYNNQQANNGN